MSHRPRTTTEDIARSIAARHPGVDPLTLLGERLSPSELRSLELSTMRARARRATFASVLRFAEANPLVHASALDARDALRLDALAFEAAEGFEAVELSPVSVLGMNALAGVDQNNVLSATRGVEVMADPTSALAVECARRRRRGPRTDRLHLACSHRLVRMQPFDSPEFSRHFRLFTLASAGRDVGDDGFERGALLEQGTVWLRLVERLAGAGYDVARARLEVSDSRIVRALLAEHGVDEEALRGHVSPDRDNSANARLGLSLPAAHADPDRALPPSAAPARARQLARLQRIEATVLGPLRAAFPSTETRFDLQKLHGLRYYDGLTLSVVIVTRSGRELPLGDGGQTAWTQDLLSDRKERFFASALASEIIARFLSPSPR